mgnify:CR=1 FL=1
MLDAFGGSIGRFTDAPKNGSLGICRLHGMQHTLDRLGIDVIVGVHKKDGLALGGIDTGISSTRDARISWSITSTRSSACATWRNTSNESSVEPSLTQTT